MSPWRIAIAVAPAPAAAAAACALSLSCRRQQLDAERLRSGRPDHARVRHWVARHHGGFTSRLLAAAGADARDPVRRHDVPCAGGRLLPVESWTTVMTARSSPIPSARAALRRGMARSGGGVAATDTGRRTDGEPNAVRGWTVFQIPSAPWSLRAVGWSM